ncbi:glycoside hydrolase family 18 [Chitinophaga sp. 212800010-3]|uniref:glycoside hydrolase family 18 n=1 Tax=unclassified Chitinophaga TaxID=2619133 RepID=UPI002DE617E0|nr:Endo-beta-N-acetylglucosaminidase F2 [Chitinophaga sp. 212800010-3]
MKIILRFALILLLIPAGEACKKQNEPAAIALQHPKVLTDQYLEALRAYKKSDHQVAFGWFGNSGGDGKSPAMNVRWESIPDSMDIVSFWGGMPADSSPQMAAMRFAQEKKGTKMVQVTFTNDPFFTHYGGGDFLKKYKDPGDEATLIQGFELVAKALADEVNKNRMDGIDLDHEPHVCGCSNWTTVYTPRNFGLFLKALSKYFGPKSGTGKLLIVDGEIDQVPADAGAGLSYAISQAYGTSSPGSINGRYGAVSGWLPPEKYIVTENFEDFWKTGGVDYNDPVRGKIPSLLGMAYWQPAAGRKGGMGAYHAEYEYANPTMPYLYMRQAIQIMNPAVR